MGAGHCGLQLYSLSDWHDCDIDNKFRRDSVPVGAAASGGKAGADMGNDCGQVLYGRHGSVSVRPFPFRDGLRRIKAYFAYDVLQQKENNEIYVVQNHAAKLEYPLNEASVRRLAAKMTGLWQQYFPDQKVWYAVVPDKNYFLAAKNGYPSMDYERMIRLLSQELAKNTDFVYVDIISDLTIDDYYHTDTHWRQERILDVAHHLSDAMGVGGALNFSKGYDTGFKENEIQDFMVCTMDRRRFRWSRTRSCT